VNRYASVGKTNVTAIAPQVQKQSVNRNISSVSADIGFTDEIGQITDWSEGPERQPLP
jgi:hypothetical protein